VAELREKGMLVPFLSNIYVPNIEGGVEGYIAVPADKDKFSASLVLPDTNKPTNVLRLCIILGIYITGAWYDEKWSKILSEAYNRIYRMGDTEGQYEFQDMDEALVQFLYEINMKLSWGLPSRQFMLDFNLRDRDYIRKTYVGGWGNDMKPDTKDSFETSIKDTKVITENVQEAAGRDFTTFFNLFGVERKIGQPVAVVSSALNDKKVNDVVVNDSKPFNVLKDAKTGQVMINNPSLFMNKKLDNITAPLPPTALSKVNKRGVSLAPLVAPLPQQIPAPTSNIVEGEPPFDAEITHTSINPNKHHKVTGLNVLNINALASSDANAVPIHLMTDPGVKTKKQEINKYNEWYARKLIQNQQEELARAVTASKSWHPKGDVKIGKDVVDIDSYIQEEDQYVVESPKSPPSVDSKFETDDDPLVGDEEQDKNIYDEDSDDNTPDDSGMHYEYES